MIRISKNFYTKILTHPAAIETASYYGIKQAKAKSIAVAMAKTVDKEWSVLAKRYHIHKSVVDEMSPAFQEARNYSQKNTKTHVL